MNNMEKIVKIEPPDHAAVQRCVQQLRDVYGDRLTVESVGTSLLGRSIAALHIGTPDAPVLYCGGVHGREWITTLLLLYFCEDALRACTCGERVCGIDMNRLFDKRGLVVIPALNPDGVEISINGADNGGLFNCLDDDLSARCRNREFCRCWKANARGVDINRNFNAGWDDMRAIAMDSGICGPAAAGWTGEYPESEPETRAVVALCARTSFRHVIAFHAQGEEIYWNYRDCTPPKAHLMARILSASCGYALREPCVSASSAGLKDWFMETYRAPAFTVEIGRGECPLPLSQFRFLYNRLREMLALGAAI